MNEQREWFLKIKSFPSEVAVKIVKMTTKDLEHYINLVDKAVVRFERIDSSFERSSTVGKMLTNSTARYRETAHERKSNLFSKLHYLILIVMATSTLTNHHPDQSSAINIKARPSTRKKIMTC